MPFDSQSWPRFPKGQRRCAHTCRIFDPAQLQLGLWSFIARTHYFLHRTSRYCPEGQPKVPCLPWLSVQPTSHSAGSAAISRGSCRRSFDDLRIIQCDGYFVPPLFSWRMGKCWRSPFFSRAPRCTPTLATIETISQNTQLRLTLIRPREASLSPCLSQVLINGVVSRGRCNTGLQFIRRSLKSQCFSRPLIETQSDFI